MANLAIPFQDLAKRIQQQEAELVKLRQELESRQTHLTGLTRRKEELQAEIEKIDQEIEAVGQRGIPAKASATPGTPSKSTTSATKSPATSKASGKRTEGISLPKYLVNLVKQAKGPITTKELTDEVVRNKF